MDQVVVRFAPSPTGFLHIGGARTAIYNVMFARRHNGRCILRIDDTDLVRSDEKYEEDILSALSWLGLKFDEFYKQSRRAEIYERYIDVLKGKGLTYTEKGEKGEAVIFRPERKELFFQDIIRGKITLPAEEVADIVIKKSDGTPTYIFASTADDIDMGVTHIIRGEDHITNTFKQLLLFQALCPERMPGFAHLPLILAEDGSRLSKRHGATAVTEFRTMGYVAEALRNYVMLLGWSPGNNIEMIDFDEACRVFEISKVRKKGSQFSYDKASWMNSLYIQKMSAEAIIEQCTGIGLEKVAGYRNNDEEKLKAAVALAKDRVKVLKDVESRVGYFFEGQDVLSPELYEKHLSDEKGIKRWILPVKKVIEQAGDFTAAALESILREEAGRLAVPTKDILVPLRVILTGQNVTPGIFQVMELMGRGLCVKRIEAYLSSVKE